MQLQKWDPLFNMEVNVIRPAFNFEPKYGVTKLIREEWTTGPGILLQLRGSSDIQIGPGFGGGGTGIGVYWQSLGRRLSISLGKYAAVFQAEIYATLVGVHEIHTDGRGCQNNIPIGTYNSAKRYWMTFTPDILGLFWILGHSSVHGNEIADEFTREGLFTNLLDWNQPWGVFRQNIIKKIKCWMDNQHTGMWCLISTQRQA